MTSKKRLKRVTLYIFGFEPTLPSQLVTYFSEVQTHQTLRISDVKSNFFLFKIPVYISSNNVSTEGMGFIKPKITNFIISDPHIAILAI